MIKVRANSWLILGMLSMLCMLFPGFSASADPAAEITQSCEFSIFSGKKTALSKTLYGRRRSRAFLRIPSSSLRKNTRRLNLRA